MKVLVVGCGNIAGGFDAARDPSLPPLTHAGAYTRHGDFQMVACVEPDEGRRRAFMARWGVPVGVTQLEELQPGIADVVSICSPTGLHGRHVDAALALRPRAIFCEKPLAPTLAESHRLVEACARQQVALAVNHTRRWAADARQLAQQLAAGQWGSVRSAVGWYGKGILNNGSHLLDLLLWFLGPLRPVWAGPAVHDFWEDDPTVAAALLTVTGAPVQLVPTHAGDYSLFELQLVTQRGIICMESGGMSWRRRTPAPSPDFPGYAVLSGDEREAGACAQAMLAAVGNLHDHLLHGALLASTGHSALQAQSLCETLRGMSTRGPDSSRP
jgi:predicted dehydrogenase